MPWSVYNSTGKLLQSLAIGDDSIVEGKLDVSNAPTNGYFLQAQSGEGGGLTWAAAGGIASVVADTSPQLGGNLDMQARLLVGNGGSTGIAISANGEVTMAAQPLVIAINSAQDNDQTGGGTDATIDFNTEIKDQNADFASDTFTAPVTGTYRIDTSVYTIGGTSSMSQTYMRIKSSNKNWSRRERARVSTGDVQITASALIDMDAADTVYITLQDIGGSDTVDIYGTTSEYWTYFSAQLVA